jgi:molybdopterin converting factor small subunit
VRPGRPGARAAGEEAGAVGVVVVTVKYVFGLARTADGRDTLALDLPPGATVFEALRRLGLSALELHAAVNGESAADGTVLRDGDEVILIPSIQGGSGPILVAAG